MNRVYTPLFIVIFLIVNIPRVAFAQCNCSAGVPATPLTYYKSFPPTTSATTTISFPQFAPSVGQLQCLSVWDTATGVTSTTALNKDLVDSVEYTFLLALTANFKGPPGGGISISNSQNRTYGPNTLAPLGHAGDDTTYGPDTLFNGITGFGQTSGSTAPYIGGSNSDFTFGISGGVVTTEGGVNYTAGPATTYWGAVSLTYYWCPNVALSTTIQDLTASPQGKSIQLQWIIANQQPNTQYEIQVSPDGKNFYDAGQAEANAASAGSSTKYQYQYYPDPTYVGKLYFRVQETDPSGKVSMSVIVIVDPNDPGADQAISYQTFPNPATNSLQVQFNSNQTGHFLVQLVATSGQIVQEEDLTLAGSSQIRLDLNPKPSSGLYFLRTSDLTHNRSYVTKVFVQ
jgi:Secretion system C-terminal sorting domain